jgi:hypothetical protein
LRSCNFDPATMNSVRSFASLWTIWLIYWFWLFRKQFED